MENKTDQIETIMSYTIKKNGCWYNFESIPQEHRYIKICNLNCGTDRKAINQARKIIGDPHAKVIVS
jgi:hypothetical protein